MSLATFRAHSAANFAIRSARSMGWGPPRRVRLESIRHLLIIMLYIISIFIPTAAGLRHSSCGRACWVHVRRFGTLEYLPVSHDANPQRSPRLVCSRDCCIPLLLSHRYLFRGFSPAAGGASHPGYHRHPQCLRLHADAGSLPRQNTGARACQQP